ncbi:dockerin type I domain-containing protein [Novipirellula herctigrandis]
MLNPRNNRHSSSAFRKAESGQSQRLRKRKFGYFQALEARQLLTTLLVDGFAVNCPEIETIQAGVESVTIPASDLVVSVSNNDAIEQSLESQSVVSTDKKDSNDQVDALALPSDLPSSFSVSIEYSGERLTLHLEKNSIFGENTRFLVDNGSGTLVQVDAGADRSYLGKVVEHPEFDVSALLTAEGLKANIIRPNQNSLTIEPLENSSPSGIHKISVAEGVDFDDECDHDENHDDEVAAAMAVDPSVDANATPIVSSNYSEVTSSTIPSTSAAMSSGATLPPTKVMDVLEYEIGVEIGSAALLNNYSGTTVEQKVASAMAEAQKIPGNLDARYLRSAGIKYRLGTVIIRTGSDPFSVSNGNDSSGLSAFRNYWNNNPQEVGNTHDLAVYHVRSSPSGLAYVNSVGTSNRYALTASNGPSSWADGTLAHEFGHSWNLRHTSDSGFFYESKPRDNSGTDEAGGSEVFVSIMHGGGDHNIGRLASAEADEVYKIRNQKRSYGTPYTPGAVAPFGHNDTAVVSSSARILDVIANDYDVNNDVLDVQLLDTVSQKGGTISLSVGTGPGGRNEILYTAPAGVTGEDFFHYTVFDTSGKTDFGAVNITIPDPVTVDLTQTVYNYDPGTDTSPVFSGATRLTSGVQGEVFFSGGDVSGVDRGDISGVNAYNRDFIRGTSPATFNHRVVNGHYRVTLNMSDPTGSLDNMFVSGEGVTLASDIDRPVGTNATFNVEVDVVDGQLNLEFGDADTIDPAWAVTRIVVTQQYPFVDLTQTVYNYDPGTDTSPVFSGATRLAPVYQGEVYFSGGTVDAVDRGDLSGVNAYNRDFISGTAPATFNHRVINGQYRVTLNMSDPIVALDNMFVRGEGVTLASDIDRPIGTNTTFTVDVNVYDGQLNLEFGDADTVDPAWAVTRIVLTQQDVFEDPTVVNLTQTSYRYDVQPYGLSTFDSTYVPLTDKVNGDIYFTSSVASIDNGSAPGANGLNRDGIFITSGSMTLEHKVADGVYDVLVTVGDLNHAMDDMVVSAEAGAVVSTSMSTNANQYLNTFANGVAVSDGSLSLTFTAEGGTNDRFATTRIIITRTGDLPTPATIESRLLFYNNSDFDGNDSAANTADEGAIASDKQALLPGQNASFANYTSYSRGVNGIIIDIANLPASGLSADDFTLRVGNDSDTSTFTDLEIVPGFSRRTGEGANSSDRITLTLPDKAVVGKWLQVTVKANENTALETPDVFYFGNAPGEVGNSTDDTSVSNADVLKIRLNRTAGGTTVDSTSPYDINRDQIVSNADVLLARLGRTTSEAELKLITPSGASNFSSIVGVSALQATDTNADGVVSAMDALLVINHLSGSTNNTSGEETASQEKWSHLDVDGNGHVTALDALMVINEMNRSQTNPNSSVSQSPQAFDLALRDLQSEDEEDDIQLLDSRLDSV